MAGTAALKCGIAKVKLLTLHTISKRNHNSHKFTNLLETSGERPLVRKQHSFVISKSVTIYISCQSRKATKTWDGKFL